MPMDLQRPPPSSDGHVSNAPTSPTLLEKFQSVRQKTLRICEPLTVEDYVVQPRAEVSPPKWHLGHTTWFFEKMILEKFHSDFNGSDQRLDLLFNSYYKGLGEHWLQQQRGSLSRPKVSEVVDYRHKIDEQIEALIVRLADDPEVCFLVELGLNHEQQHQELLLMDIKSILAINPIFPSYSSNLLPEAEPAEESWQRFSEGIYSVGHTGPDFSYDNEGPKHKTYIYPFAISNSTVSNRDFLQFISSQGYQSSELWLSQGWDWVQQNQISCPLYWLKQDDQWFHKTLHGLLPIDLDGPLTHISYYEAYAFAVWAGCRLPTEQESEVFLGQTNQEFEESKLFHPHATQQNTGQVWWWTASAYSPYPRFREFSGSLSEYNGKFMCHQFVLRGGCVATPEGHYRNTYRNFYHPEQRWMFSGIRLAKDI